MFFILLCDDKFEQFICTGSSFLHIMITHYVEFCKNVLRVMPLTIFHSNHKLLLIMKITRKLFLFHLWKIRAEDRCTLSERQFLLRRPLRYSNLRVPLYSCKGNILTFRLIITSVRRLCFKCCGKYLFHVFDIFY